jgi:hydroxymethylpyrimidine/phosphomethylpyrimidine kinase
LSPPSNPPSFPERSAAGAEGSFSSAGSDPNSRQTSPPVVLSIAGYDPSAGAGVLADLKTFAAVGVYGMACITALTVQSTQGVRKVIGLDAGVLIETLDCLAEDASIDSIKVGMLGNAVVARAVVNWLQQRKAVPVVLDPILKSSSGKDLLDADGKDVLRQAWLGRADWITPNLAELAALAGTHLPVTRAETEDAARVLQRMATERGNAALKIVVTGGHGDAPDDLLLAGDEIRWFPGKRVETSSTHGTGCAFSSALAARIALGDEPQAAVQAAKAYVAGALQYATPLGKGAGPLNHFWKTTSHTTF